MTPRYDRPLFREEKLVTAGVFNVQLLETIHQASLWPFKTDKEASESRDGNRGSRFVYSIRVKPKPRPVNCQSKANHR
jgi:hypothetical protein